MFDFHEKRKIKRWLFSKPVIALLLVLCFFLGRSAYERYTKERETAIKHHEQAAELLALTARANALEKEVAYMQSARGGEQEIRQRFDAVKEGERAVIIIDNKGSTTPRVHGVEALQQEEGMGARFLSWIRGLW